MTPRWKRIALTFALEIPLAAVLVLVDAFVWKWLPAAAYVATVIYIVVALPWAMEGVSLCQFVRRPPKNDATPKEAA